MNWQPFRSLLRPACALWARVFDNLLALADWLRGEPETVSRRRRRKYHPDIEPLERRQLLNTAPVIEDWDLSLASSTIDEGDAASLSGSFYDEDWETHQVQIDWGDGSDPTTLNLSEGESSFSDVTHTYVDNGEYPFDIQVTVTDSWWQSDSATIQVTVENVAPTLSYLSASDIDENETATLSGSFADPGSSDSFSLYVDWGDGQSDSYNYDPGFSGFSESHQYLDDGSYEVSVSLVDKDYGQDEGSVTVNVDNVPVALTDLTLSAAEIDEGESVTLTGVIDDPGTLDLFTISVDWGDGTDETFIRRAGSFSFNHTYLDDNPSNTAADDYTVAVDVVERQFDRLVGLDNVLGASPQAETAELDATAQQFASLQVGAQYLIQDGYEWDWDDSEIITPTSLDSYSKTITAAFTFPHPDGASSWALVLFTGTISSDSASDTVTVSNIAPQLSNVSVVPGPPGIDENGSISLSGDIFDPGILDPVTLEVSWGDGTSDTYYYDPGTTGFATEHQYLDNPNGYASGEYSISLTLSDDDTGSDLDGASAWVSNVAPQLQSVQITNSNESRTGGGAGSVLTGSIVDPGTLDSFTLLVQWGDGTENTYNYPAGTTSFSESHHYKDDGPSGNANGTPSDDYNVSLTLTDKDGGSDSTSVTATVYNLAPSVGLSVADEWPAQLGTPFEPPLNAIRVYIGSPGAAQHCGNFVVVGAGDPGLDDLSIGVDRGSGLQYFSVGPESFDDPLGAFYFTEDDGPGPWTYHLTASDDDTGVFDDYVTIYKDENQLPILDYQSGQRADLIPEQGYAVTIGDAGVNVAGQGLHLEVPLDFDRSPGTSVGFNPVLYYDSATLGPDPVIRVTVTNNCPEANGPEQFQARVIWDGNPLDWVTFDTSTLWEPGYTYPWAPNFGVDSDVDDVDYVFQLPLGFPVAPGMHPFTVELSMHVPENPADPDDDPAGFDIEQTVSGTLEVTSRNQANPYGAGWWLSSLDQLFANGYGDVRIVYGAGSSRFYYKDATGFIMPADDFGTLEGDAQSGWVYTSKYGEERHFDTTGRLVSIVDPHGLTTAYDYDSDGRLIQVAAIDGGVTTLSYANGYLASITQPGGRTLSFTIDAQGDLVALTDAAGFERDFTYDSDHYLSHDDWDPFSSTFTYDAAPDPGADYPDWDPKVLASINLGLGSVWQIDEAGQIVDPLGHTNVYESAPYGRLASMTRDDDSSASWSYDPSGQLDGWTDFGGSSGSREYDYENGPGNLVRIVYPDQSYETFEYDPVVHRPTVHRDRGGDVTTFTYDSQTGDLLTVTDPMGITTEYVWDDGLLLSSSRNGKTTSFTYDAARRLIEIENPLGATSGFSYDSAGNPLTRADFNGHVTTTVYDERNQLVERHSPAGGVVSWEYRAAGMLDQTTNARGFTTVNDWDQRGFLVSVTRALGEPEEQTTDFGYDLDGSRTTQTDALGRVSTFVYDSLHRRTETIDALGNVTTVVYDASNNVKNAIDALGRVTTFTYDTDNRLVTTTDPLGRVTTNVWDAEGLLLARIEPVNRQTAYAYDAADRPYRVTDAENQVTTTVYDADGLVSATIDARNNQTDYLYDDAGRLSTATDALDGVTTYLYDAQGNRTEIIDPLGRRTTFIYDEENRLVSSIDPLGNRTTTVYDANGNVVESVDARGNPTAFSYDALDRLVETEDALGNLTTFAYDAVGNRRASIDARGFAFTYTYDALNRLTETEDPLGNLATVVYDKVGNTVNTIDPRGNTTTFTYDALNRLTQTEDALHNLSTTVYDADGNVGATIDARGNRTSFTYDLMGRRTLTEDALNNLTTTAYDAVGNVRYTIDPRGSRTDLEYDELNRLIEIEDAFDHVSYLDYDAAGNVRVMVDTLGRRTTFTYDGLDRLTQTEDALGNLATTVYDANGNAIASVDPLGERTTFTYDALNRLTQTEDALNNLSTTVYDAVGNAVNSIDPLGNVTTFVYDAINRQTETIDAEGGVTTLLYDAASNQTGIIDPVGNRTTFVYDELNQLVERADPLGNSTTYAYDEVGNLSSTTDRLGRRRDIDYDALHRRTAETWWDDQQSNVNTLVFTWDAGGNLLTATDNAGTYTFTYDALSRVATQQDVWGKTLTFSYDNVGNRTLVQDSEGGLTTSTYDALDRLARRQFSDGTREARIDLAYTDRGELETVTRYADLDGTELVGTSDYSYDGLGRLGNLHHRDGGNDSLANFTYTYDAGSRVTSETLDGVTTTYSYDDTNQLTDDSTTEYSYDSNGNRTMSGYEVGDNNRLLSDGTWDYSYDDEGNRIGKENPSTGDTWWYTYDHDNRLVKVEYAEVPPVGPYVVSTMAEFVYDVFGNRVESEIDADGEGGNDPEVTRFTFDGDHVWADLDASSSLTNRRIFGDVTDQAFVRIGDQDYAWYYPDRLGSIRIISDETGALLYQAAYDGFGNIISETNPENRDRLGWTGREFEPVIGLWYFRARYIDPWTGLFLSEDPIGFSAGDSNLNRYVGNNATNATDPSGLEYYWPWQKQASFSWNGSWLGDLLGGRNAVEGAQQGIKRYREASVKEVENRYAEKPLVYAAPRVASYVGGWLLEVAEGAVGSVSQQIHIGGLLANGDGQGAVDGSVAFTEEVAATSRYSPATIQNTLAAGIVEFVDWMRRIDNRSGHGEPLTDLDRARIFRRFGGTDLSLAHRHARTLDPISAENGVAFGPTLDFAIDVGMAMMTLRPSGPINPYGPLKSLPGANPALVDEGSYLASRAKDLLTQIGLTRAEKKATTIAVGNVLENGQFVQKTVISGSAPASAVEKIRRVAPSAIQAEGPMHAETYLYLVNGGRANVRSMAVSHWNGPCEKSCYPFFMGRGYNNIWWYGYVR